MRVHFFNFICTPSQFAGELSEEISDVGAPLVEARGRPRLHLQNSMWGRWSFNAFDYAQKAAESSHGHNASGATL